MNLQCSTVRRMASASRTLIVTMACAGSIALKAQSIAPETGHPELVVQTGTSYLTTVGDIAPSPNGQWYVTQQDDGFAVWSVSLGAQVEHITRRQHGQVWLAVAADSRTILSVDLFGSTGPDWTTTIDRTDAFTGQDLAPLKVPGLVTGLAANSAEMVYAIMDGSESKVEIRSLVDNTVIFSDIAADVKNPPAGLRTLRFSPDGSLIFLANADRLVGWDWHTRQRVLEFVAASNYSQDLDRQVAVNYSSGKTVSTARQERYSDLQMVDLSADGMHLLACSKDELTRFDYEPGEKRFKKGSPRIGPVGKLNMACGFFPGDRYFASSISPTRSDMGSLLYPQHGEKETPLQVTITKVTPIPRSSLYMALLVGQPPLLIREDGSVVSRDLPAPIPAYLPTFSKDGSKLWWGEATRHPLYWDTVSGEATRDGSIIAKNVIFSFSADTSRLTSLDPDSPALEDHLMVSDAGNGKVLARYPVSWGYVPMKPSLDAKGEIVAYLGEDGNLHVNHVGEDKPVFSLDIKKSQQNLVQASLSPDGRELAIGLPDGVTVYGLPSGGKVANFPYDGTYNVMVHPQFSPNGAWLVVPRSTEPMRLISTRDWKAEQHLSPAADMDTVSFSSDGKLIAYQAIMSPNEEFNRPGDHFGAAGALAVDDIATGKHIYVEDGAFACAAISPDGRYLVAQTSAGAQLIDTRAGKELATMYIFGHDEVYDWLVITPDGLFDGSPAAWTRVNWRMSSTSLEVAPAELFFREFYHPGLLGELLAGKRPTAPVNIGAVDRRQPLVTLHADGNLDAVATRTVSVQITVSESRTADPAHRGGSGAQDLRLFRNGTLVKVWRGKLHLDAQGQAVLKTDVPIVAAENRFTAYAFNTANIKSNDASLLVTGVDALKREGTAYILAIGINQYAADRPGARLNLKYARADATDFSLQFARHQQDLGEFGAVKIAQLSDADATRANILAALAVLAGTPKAQLGEAQRQLLEPLDAALPEDGIFIFYAGHGAARSGHFYLLAHDLDPSRDPVDPASHAISDADLSVALESISPVREFLVIDACQSGTALDTSGEAVGPMNSTGLAQLAYEKGLYILAASQAMESALEAPELAGGHGYLTYALVEDGLRSGAAAQEGVTELRPWFEYASRRVPGLETNLMNRALQSGRGSMIDPDPGRSLVGRQHPRVFYRREPELAPFVVARTATSEPPPTGNPHQP